MSVLLSSGSDLMWVRSIGLRESPGKKQLWKMTVKHLIAFSFIQNWISFFSTSGCSGNREWSCHFSWSLSCKRKFCCRRIKSAVFIKKKMWTLTRNTPSNVPLYNVSSPVYNGHSPEEVKKMSLKNAKIKNNLTWSLPGRMTILNYWSSCSKCVSQTTNHWKQIYLLEWSKAIKSVSISNSIISEKIN